MPPLSLMIKPASSLCNMRCTYCFYSDVAAHRQTPSFGVMSEAVLEKLLQRTFAFAEGLVSLAFQGGEPTLAGKAFFRQLLAMEKKLNRRGVRIIHSLQTNGYDLDEEWMDIFREGSFLIGVSLDGTAALHDACRIDAAGQVTYERILKNIRLLEKHHIDYNILCVVHQEIAKQPENVFHTLAPHRFLQFIPCLDDLDGNKSPWSLDAETYGQFLIKTFDLYEQALYAGHPVSIRNFDNWVGMLLGYPPENCGMSGRCGRYFLIESDGGVYPCDFYVLDDWRLGDVRQDSFFKLDKSEIGKRFRDDSLTLPQDCARCPYLALCRGGCKRDREPIVDGKPSGNRLCIAHKRFFDARMDAMKKMARFLAKKQKNT